eukprot:2567326-Amphidinium_carterae.1
MELVASRQAVESFVGGPALIVHVLESNLLHRETLPVAEVHPSSTNGLVIIVGIKDLQTLAAGGLVNFPTLEEDPKAKLSIRSIQFDIASRMNMSMNSARKDLASCDAAEKDTAAMSQRLLILETIT